jgi:hypothetical protein
MSFALYRENRCVHSDADAVGTGSAIARVAWRGLLSQSP